MHFVLALLLVLCSYGVDSARFVIYVDALNQWWPPEKIAAGMALPGYGANHSYNVVNLAFWTTGGLFCSVPL